MKGTDGRDTVLQDIIFLVKETPLADANIHLRNYSPMGQYMRRKRDSEIPLPDGRRQGSPSTLNQPVLGRLEGNRICEGRRRSEGGSLRHPTETLDPVPPIIYPIPYTLYPIPHILSLSAYTPYPLNPTKTTMSQA